MAMAGRADGEAADEALRASEARFRLMADAVPQIVWITDADGRVEFFNQQWAAYTGKTYVPTTAAEVAATAVHPDDAAVTLERFEAARRMGGVFEVEHRIRAASGEYRWFLVRAAPYRDLATGEVVRWFGASVDIHDRKQAEAALTASEEAARARLVELEAARGEAEAARAAVAESESKFRFALAVADLGAWDLDPATQRVWRSPRHDQIFGYDALLPEWTYAQFLAHVVPEDRARVDAIFGGALAAAAPWDFTCRIRRADGAERWVSVRGEPIRDGAGVSVRLAGVVQDVTAEREGAAEREHLLAESETARAAAERERQRLAVVLEHLPLGVTFAEAPAGAHSVSNPAAEAIWGVLPASPDVAAYSREFVGFRPGDAAEAERRVASHEWPLARALTRGEVVRDEVVEIERPDGARRVVSLSAAPVRDARGAIRGALVTSTDVTEREAMLQALDAARRAAEAANQAKSAFLANVSHELRTPLNAIGGYAQLLELGLHGPVTDEQRQALGRVQGAQTRLLSLINDILNYAKLESGRVEYDVVAVDVRDVVAEVTPLVEPQLKAKGLAFDARLPEAPCVVWADREKLGQVLVNLLSNAVKFTDSPDPRTGAAGRVTIGVAARADGPDGGRPELAFVRVSDTGRGIPRAKQEAIFEPFVQVRASGSVYAHATEGTGLGLAISRDLARGMGGDLRVRSREGGGSTFTVTLRRVIGTEARRRNSGGEAGGV